MQPYPQPNTGSASERGYGAMPEAPGNWNRGFAGGVPLASWGWRLAAAVIDYIPAIFICSLIADAHASALAWVIFLAWIGFNSVYMQGTTGQSIGKRLVGIRTAAAAVQGDGSYLVYPGVARCFFRFFAHIFDIIPFYTGFIRPLWQRQYRTWADSATKTVVTSREWTGTLERRAPGARRVPGF